jgi:glycosyltransferase involved in cell wall biosynthesis
MQWIVDVTETYRSGRQTGVQRVVRELARGLASRPGVALVTFDYSRGRYLSLTEEQRHRFFGPQVPAPARGSPPKGLPVWARRFASFLLDGFRRAVLYPLIDRLVPLVPGELPRTPGPRVVLTAEIVGDRARGRRLKAWARREGTALAFVVHDLIPWSAPGLSSLHARDFDRYLGLLAQARVVFPVSDTTKNDLERWMAGRDGAGPDLVRVYPGFEVPGGPAQEPADPPVFLCVGTVEARKNPCRLLGVLEELWERGRKFRFLFVGGPSPTSGPFAQRLGDLLRGGRPVEWLTEASDEDLDRHYRRATASVYLSGTEGFGLPVVESVARGTPCIASDRHAVGEVAREFGGCLTVDPGDPETWSRALTTFLDHPHQRTTLAATIRWDRIRPWAAYAETLVGELDSRLQDGIR